MKAGRYVEGFSVGYLHVKPNNRDNRTENLELECLMWKDFLKYCHNTLSRLSLSLGQLRA